MIDWLFILTIWTAIGLACWVRRRKGPGRSRR